MTSKDITARLVVSTRTVDSHLDHVARTLGMQGRDQLASALTVVGTADAPPT